MPLTPAGIGFVEGGVVGLLTLVYAVSQTDALAITLVDRAISVLSIIILGSIAYAISPKRRGLGLTAPEPPVAASASTGPIRTATNPVSTAPTGPGFDRRRRLATAHVRTGDMVGFGARSNIPA